MQNQYTSSQQPFGGQFQMPQSNQIPNQMNHGGHEVFDLHEVLSGMINVLDQYMMFRVFVKGPELMNMIDRQYSFILDNYNITCEAFQTGTEPSHHTKKYMMNESNTVTFGIKPSQPKKPNQSIEDINDQGIAGHMLGLIKSTASLLTMTSLEVTNPVVRRVLVDSVPNFVEMAYEIFLYQNKQHQYQVPQLSQQDMNSMVQGFAPITGQPTMPTPSQMYKPMQ
ncbi:spore coat protein [Alkalihalobacillus deserti]|uniref:spore coat protein n=1 Tax=Alkalihalobacillus deserti TaxID=2879466 RepID=UPI003555FEE7